MHSDEANPHLAQTLKLRSDSEGVRELALYHMNSLDIVNYPDALIVVAFVCDKEKCIVPVYKGAHAKWSLRTLHHYGRDSFMHRTSSEKPPGCLRTIQAIPSLVMRSWGFSLHTLSLNSASSSADAVCGIHVADSDLAFTFKYGEYEATKAEVVLQSTGNRALSPGLVSRRILTLRGLITTFPYVCGK
ncbi:hypothetical protein BU23DRAFT_573125 [Bimuria novae-zelandiae CBS 107.79]|uniref:Uncharacterized protein n=1 Tax=Bimuria novae-zelandiae CBS 107.79 TaxID=1447943 RepID=A0A6A5UUS8_9PLEO|nr:hypothetical protein BU23DRAFT_573125 [Bimuria novae-zelandiae CBS 107.79]